MEVSVWVPWVLAGAELAIRRDDPRSKLGGWVVAGFALSQTLAAWLGQGSYYVLLALAGYIAYRTLVAPCGLPSMRSRVGNAAMHGAAIALIGFGLATAGVLPRLEYVARTNLAGGEYAGTSVWAARISGVSSSSVFDQLLVPTLYYPGTSTLALALTGVLLARGRFAAPYFGLLGLAATVLASPGITPWHRLLFAVLPRFEALHQHWPERVSVVAYVVPSLLAGAAVAVLLEQTRWTSWRMCAVLSPIAAAIGLRVAGAGVPNKGFVVAGATVVLLLALLATPAPAGRRAIPGLLVAVIVADLLLASQTIAAQAPYGGFHRIDIRDYYGSTGAAAFILDETLDAPARVFGYDPTLRAIQDGQTVLYRNQFADPATRALNVNNRAMILGLQDIQGYNPIQVRRYAEFMLALNGHAQDYHDANVFPSGLTSPLLDLLNARFVVIPAETSGGQAADVRWPIENFPVVYEDLDVRVLENPEALPRAWIVHSVRQVAPGEALALLASEAVDPRETALIEQPPPAVSTPIDPSADRVTILDYQPDRIRARASTTAAGLVVFSEVFDPGWHAWVDGAPVPVHLVDHVLRAIPLAAGFHEIELRYRIPALLIGTGVTAITTAALVVAGAVLRNGPQGRKRGIRVGWRSPDRHAARNY